MLPDSPAVCRLAPSAGFAGTSPAARGRIATRRGDPPPRSGGGGPCEAWWRGPSLREVRTMILRFFLNGLDWRAGAVITILVVAGVAIPLLNLYATPESPFYVPTYVVALLGK